MISLQKTQTASIRRLRVFSRQDRIHDPSQICSGPCCQPIVVLHNGGGCKGERSSAGPTLGCVLYFYVHCWLPTTQVNPTAGNNSGLKMIFLPSFPFEDQDFNSSQNSYVKTSSSSRIRALRYQLGVQLLPRILTPSHNNYKAEIHVCKRFKPKKSTCVQLGAFLYLLISGLSVCSLYMASPA